MYETALGKECGKSASMGRPAITVPLDWMVSEGPSTFDGLIWSSE